VSSAEKQKRRAAGEAALSTFSVPEYESQKRGKTEEYPNYEKATAYVSKYTG